MTTMTDRESEARDVALRSGVSDRQFDFLLRLARERVIPDLVDADARVDAILTLVFELHRLGVLTKREVSQRIDELLQLPRATVEVALTPGVYELDGVAYVVKPNRAGTNLYAKQLVELGGSARRLNELDDHVPIEFVYAPGAVRALRPEHRMPLERAKALTIRYGRCVNCGRSLKAAVSVERGIGPVCVKAFGA